MRQQNPLGHAVDEEKKAPSLGAGQVEETKLNSAPWQRIDYDALGRIVSVITQPEVSSSVGQIDEAQHNLTQAVSTTYTYDAYGQLIGTHQTVEHPQANLPPPLDEDLPPPLDEITQLDEDEVLPLPLDEEPAEAAQPIGPAGHGGLAHNAMGFFSQPVAEQGDEKTAPGAQPSATP